MHELRQEIDELKKERHAVVLAHYYQPGEVQDAADFVGDSLALCFAAARTDADLIVFAGVSFMAESAKLLNPGKRVLLTEEKAGCPMADMVTAPALRELKAAHPEALVVCYVNSSAAVKAESDVCCTSSNAVRIVQSLPADQEIIFVPDKHLGQYVMDMTGRPLILWPGFCPTHQRFHPETVAAARAARPGSEVLVHPEAPQPIRSLADYLGSTGQIIEYCGTSPAAEFIICTEEGVVHELQKRYPDKRFHVPSHNATCPNMKKTSLQSVRNSLALDRYEVSVDPVTAEAANRALKRRMDAG
jgi:quinolinate synthase